MTTALYFLVAFLVFPPIWRQAFIVMSRQNPYEGERAFNVGIAAMPAVGIAILWPLSLIALPMYFWVARPTPEEKRKALQQQEAELRREAQELGLPWGETPPRPSEPPKAPPPSGGWWRRQVGG